MSDLSQIAVEVVPLKYDLACGQNKQPGFTGVDIAGNFDIQFNLKTFPWTFAQSNSVDEIFCSHFFEHLPGGPADNNVRIKFMDECYRILKVGSKMTIICPYYSSVRASQDPTHEWPPVSEMSFMYFNKNWREINRLDHYFIESDFDFEYGFQWSPEMLLKNQAYRDYALKNLINAVADIQVTLTKRP